MGLKLKYNTKLYKGDATDFTADKDVVFEENIFIFNTDDDKLYIADGTTTLENLTEINNASTGLSTYAKKTYVTSELVPYAKTADVASGYIAKAVYDSGDATISVDGTWYIDATDVYIGDGVTAVNALASKITFNT